MTESLTHATTIHQPLAWAVASGHCPIINADTRPDLARIGELIGIHASQSHAHDNQLSDLEARLGRLLSREEDTAAKRRGALIGVARLVGVVRRDRHNPGLFHRVEGRSSAIAATLDRDLCARIRPWWRGLWGWLLEEAVLLDEPIPMRGAGGLWRLPVLGSLSPSDWTRGQATAADWALEQWRKARRPT